MKIEQMTRANTARLSKEAVEELVEWAADLGLDVELKSARYGDISCSLSLDLIIQGRLRVEQRMYDLIAGDETRQLPPRDSKVRMRHDSYTVWGWNSKAPKYPVMLCDVDGTVVRKCTEDALRRATVL